MSRRLIGYPTGWTLAVLNRFGAWATEEIAPWRGRTLDLPQYMRR